MNLRFKDADGNDWIAIWQTRLKFGMSAEFRPSQSTTTPIGIRFCNLETGEERFLELPEEEIPSQEHLEERGKEKTLRSMLGRAVKSS